MARSAPALPTLFSLQPATKSVCDQTHTRQIPSWRRGKPGKPPAGNAQTRALGSPIRPHEGQRGSHRPGRAPSPRPPPRPSQARVRSLGPQGQLCTTRGAGPSRHRTDRGRTARGPTRPTGPELHGPGAARKRLPALPPPRSCARRRDGHRPYRARCGESALPPATKHQGRGGVRRRRKRMRRTAAERR